VFLAVHNNFCNFFSCHHKFYFLGTKILVEEIAENTWFTGGLHWKNFAKLEAVTLVINLRQRMV
ncbi:hypothetical protein, partial [Bacteroides pyogenes]|uniref:hypothetical protein n=1 Tax=Bacteroides pyogenes TaxID=310300 RepID=UPI0021CD1732